MEVEPSSPAVAAKKLWSLIRIIFSILRKGLTKSKLLLDLNTLLKRGKLATKAIAENLVTLHLSSSFNCRSNAAVSFVTPREYEFSCSNSPAIMHTLFNKRSNKQNGYYARNINGTRDTAATYQYPSSYSEYDDVSSVAAVQRVLEMVADQANYSPMVSLPGFGKSPKMVRKLRITDSPFPMKEEEEEEEGESKVDKEAEEFIKKFYKDLKSQKRTTSSAIESPFRGLRSR